MMIFQDIFTYFYNNPIEFWGFVFTLICVWLNTQEHILGWFFAILSAVLYAIVFFDSKIYAEFSLQIFFIVISIYGWYNWLFGKNKKEETKLSVTRIDKKLSLNLFIIFVLSSIILGLALDNLSDTDVPYLDAITTAMSLVAQWLLARKILENWLIWISANIIYIGLFLYKCLYLTSFLYFLLLLLAIKGFLDWKKSMR